MHKHRAKTTTTRAYTGSVSRDENRAAHGGVCHHETCACGAERRINSNGRHEERGAWVMPEPLSCDESENSRRAAMLLSPSWLG